MHRHSELLPISLDPATGESGVGFLLRVAATNGISMHKLRQLVGMSAAETFTAKHEDRLFALVGLAGRGVPDLLSRIVSGGGSRCYGHRFRGRTMLRFRRPQVCPSCLREAGTCWATWDLSISVVCVRHNCFLQDLCTTCHAQIRWNRPAVEWGHCKHFLGRIEGRECVSPDLIAAQRITEDIFAHQEPDFSMVGASYSGISLDAWGSLLWAWGSIPHALASPQHSLTASVPSSLMAREIVARAIARLRERAEKGREISSLTHVVADAPLIGCILDPSTESDRTIFLQMFGAVFGEYEVAALVRRHRILSQMTLF